MPAFEQEPLSQAPLSQAPLPQEPLSQAPLPQEPLSQAPLSQAPLSQAPLPGPAASAVGSGPGQKRKRGGQPGNTNALRHGFYSRKFTRQEIEDLENALLEGLQDEIALLRVQIRRLADFSGEDSCRKEAIQTLAAIGLACTRLARLMRSQRALGGDASSDSQALSETFDEVLKVWERR